MNTTRNLRADQLQILLTNSISLISTFVNFIGFYVIIVQKTKESRAFTYAQLAYQVILYSSQAYAGTVLNIVFLFPIPGAYCIGWLKDLTGIKSLIGFMIFDVLFSSQGLLLAVIIIMKVGAIARTGSPFKMTPLGQKMFLTTLVSGGILSQVCILSLTYSDRSSIESFMTREHPDMTFILRYPFIWMITSPRHFVALIFTTFVCIGVVFMILFLAYIILLVELDLQVTVMSKAKNNYNRKVVNEIVIHAMISFPFFIFVPLSIFIKFFSDDSLDLSIPTTVSFAIFTFAPIPSMLVFLIKNPYYRDYLKKKIQIRRHKLDIAAINSSENRISRVEV